MIVHISPGRHLVTVLSIPRDTMVPMYACAAGPGYTGQQADPEAYVQINALLQIGGPVCLWKTVEQQTGIYINHFIGIGMLGFVNVVNDLGGVNVCVPYNVNDPVSGLDLPAASITSTGSRPWPSGAPARTSEPGRTWSGSSVTSSCPRRW